jgi:DNA mismatch repair protein MSH4
LVHVEAQNEAESESNRIAKRRKALLRVSSKYGRLSVHLIPRSLKLKTQLTQAYEHSALPDEALREYVGRFKNDIIRAFMH